MHQALLVPCSALFLSLRPMLYDASSLGCHLQGSTRLQLLCSSLHCLLLLLLLLAVPMAKPAHCLAPTCVCCQGPIDAIDGVLRKASCQQRCPVEAKAAEAVSSTCCGQGKQRQCWAEAGMQWCEFIAGSNAGGSRRCSVIAHHHCCW